MAEDVRRRLLRRTDNILDGIEMLRMRDDRHVPERLRAELGSVASELGHPPPRSSTGLAATHSYVFRLQDLLLRSGARRQVPPSSSNPALRVDLPELTLPDRAGAEEATWREGVRLTVQRARDLARYLASQAEAARRLPGGEASELAATRADQAQRAVRQYGRLAARATRVLGHAPLLHDYAVVPATGRLALDDLTIDQGYICVFQGNRAVRLTAMEHKVLSVLAANQGEVVTREGLMRFVYGDNPEINVRSNAIDVHLGRVRNKLGNPPYLETVVKAGWRAAAPAGDRPGKAAVQRVRETRRDAREAWARRSSSAEPQQPGPGTSWSGWRANKRY